MRIKTDPANDIPRVCTISTWILDQFYKHEDDPAKGTTPEKAVARLVETLVERGILSIHDVPVIMDSPEDITPFPE